MFGRGVVGMWELGYISFGRVIVRMWEEYYDSVWERSCGNVRVGVGLSLGDVLWECERNIAIMFGRGVVGMWELE